MTTLRPLLLLPVLLLMLWTPELVSQEAPKKPRRNPDVITREEIEAHPEARSVLEVIQRLRPRFLQTRGIGNLQSSVPTAPVVVVDDVRWSGTEGLAQLAPLSVHEIRYLNGPSATGRFGTGYEAGAILIRTGKPRP